MLLHDSNINQNNYLADWPAHYYEIPTAVQKTEALESIQKQGIATAADTYRKALCEKRYFSKNKNGTIDSFLSAWIMIKASSASGVSFLTKKRLQCELEGYMEDLCLLHFPYEDEEALAVRAEEWHAFAVCFIQSCSDSKVYCSTLFGIVPIKDSIVAEKIAAEILLVTSDYPAKFGLADEFAPLREIMCEVYCQMIENGETYLHHPAQP